MNSNIKKNKNYLTLITAQLISSLGDWLSIIAVITLVGLKWEATSLQISFIILSLALPMAIFGPFSGIIADRFNRKGLMIVSDVFRAVFIIGLAFANSIWIVYACLFMTGLFASVFVPAKNGKLKEVVPLEDMKSAMSITSMIDSGTKVLGPLLSGLLVSLFGTQFVFYIDSVTFIVSAALISLLPASVNEMTQTPLEKRSFKEDLVEGMSFIKSNSFLYVGLIFLGTSLLILQLSDSQAIVLMRQIPSFSANQFGLFVATVGIGTFICGSILAKKTDYHAFKLMLSGVCLIGCGFSILAILTVLNLPLFIVWGSILGLMVGFAAGLVFIPFQASVQIKTPTNLTGRVFGVINSVSTTATIVGPLLGGILVTVIGIIPTFILTGSLLIFSFAIGLFFRSNIERGKLDVSKS
ncbi:MFS transporter [Bacillus carboniphilus]|uniref:MFS transporter n=1 Tax=Bacillus carboniphilus TaxID=86663 RepID=A0ABY9JWG3_9BACI|nr:MFS transporter [Bacillus carboniphilus]WLR42016.1 MFS transporter [Bacillus carboniphilus]